MCSSLAWQDPSEVAATAAHAAAAGVTVVSLPLVNEWTQDRSGGAAPVATSSRTNNSQIVGATDHTANGSSDDASGKVNGGTAQRNASAHAKGRNGAASAAATGSALRTPRWRGITALQELWAAGVNVALASDNTRDQFYQYGDLDMLEVSIPLSKARVRRTLRVTRDEASDELCKGQGGHS